MQRHVHNALSLRLEAGTALTATAAAWTLPLKWVHWRGRLASPARSASSAHWAIAPAHQRCLAPAVWLIGDAPGIPQLQAGVVLFPDGLSWLLCDHQQASSITAASGWLARRPVTPCASRFALATLQHPRSFCASWISQTLQASAPAGECSCHPDMMVDQWKALIATSMRCLHQVVHSTGLPGWGVLWLPTSRAASMHP